MCCIASNKFPATMVLTKEAGKSIMLMSLTSTWGIILRADNIECIHFNLVMIVRSIKLTHPNKVVASLWRHAVKD
eukprot:10650346-Ditylum_brightwellii.AAC.1